MQHVPALLVWGSSDKVFSDLYLHDLEQRLPHADVHRYPKAAHFVSEDADAFGPIIDWVSTLGQPADLAPSDDHPTALLDTRGQLDTAVAIAGSDGAADLRLSDFAARVDSTAAWLVEVGVEQGDRVALMVPPGADLAVALYACWRAGAVIVLIDSGLGPAAMSAAIKAADPAFLIGIPKALAAARVLRWPGRRFSTAAMSDAQRRLIDVVHHLPPLPRSGDPAAVVYTSGATGPSKGVCYTHGQLEAQRDVLQRVYDITTDDRLVAAFAPFALYGPALGISSIVPDMDVAAPGTLTAGALGDAAVAVDATIVFASPAALANVVRTADGLTEAHRRAFGKVRLVLSAGAPVRATLLRTTAELFPNAAVHTQYGMTECLPVANITLAEIENASGGDGVCVGIPLAEVDVRVRRLDDLGRPAGDLVADPGVLGEVVVRAAHARAGYDRLWHTEYVASQPPGWHVTGDVGHLDELGRLWIGGRLGHVISTTHGPLTPVRLEQAIELIDGVRAAAVVGVGPPRVQQVVAIVEMDVPERSPRLAPLDLVDAVRSAVTEDVVAVFEVPKLPVDRRHNSKIDRTRLSDWAEAVLAGGRLARP